MSSDDGSYNAEDFETVATKLGCSAEELASFAERFGLSPEEAMDAVIKSMGKNDMDDSYAGGEMGISMPPDPGMAYAPVCGHHGIPTRVDCALRFIELMIRPTTIAIDPAMSMGGNNQREIRDEEKPAYKAALDVMQTYLKGADDYADPSVQLRMQPTLMSGFPVQMPPVNPMHPHAKQVAPETTENSVGQAGQPPVSEESGEPGSED